MTCSNPIPRRRKHRKKSSREKITTAALTEFADNGMAGARIDRIAKTAGVNKAMIYYHFSSKENLYRQVVDEFVGDLMDRVSQAISDKATVETGLVRLAEVYTGLVTEYPEFPRLMLREMADPVGRMLGRISRILVKSGNPAQMQRLLSRGVAGGRLRRINVRQALVSFLTMNIGYFLMAPLLDRVMDIKDRKRFVKERKKAVVDLFLNGVRA
jgi:TetR/AcrR family transcriptional regulator